MKKIQQKLNKMRFLNNRGFIILFAMLISALILLISSGIYNVVQKQVVLSSYARESQKAFYAADAALDCALFNDISPLILETAFSIDPSAVYPKVLTCGGGVPLALTTNAYKLDSATTGDFGFTDSFVFRYHSPQYFDGQYIGTGCAYVLVEKKHLATTEIHTRVTASGFNTCTDSITADQFDVPDFDDPKLLERRLSISYTI